MTHAAQLMAAWDRFGVPVDAGSTELFKSILDSLAFARIAHSGGTIDYTLEDDSRIVFDPNSEKRFRIE